MLFAGTCNAVLESAAVASGGEAMTTPADSGTRTRRVEKLETTIKQLVTELNEKNSALAALEADFNYMVYIVKDFSKKYKQSQSTEEVKAEDQDLRKTLLDKDYEDCPPYILVFHGLQRDWMEQVLLFTLNSLLSPSLQTVATVDMKSVILQFRVLEIIKKASALAWNPNGAKLTSVAR